MWRPHPPVLIPSRRPRPLTPSRWGLGSDTRIWGNIKFQPRPTPRHLPWPDALRTPFRSGASDRVGKNSRCLQQLGGEAPPPAARPPCPHLGFAGVKLVLSPEAKRGGCSLEESWQCPVTRPAFVKALSVLHVCTFRQQSGQRLAPSRGREDAGGRGAVGGTEGPRSRPCT